MDAEASLKFLEGKMDMHMKFTTTAWYVNKLLDTILDQRGMEWHRKEPAYPMQVEGVCPQVRKKKVPEC